MKKQTARSGVFGKVTKRPYHLPIRTAILVPSTTQHNRPIGKHAFDHRINETRRYLSRKYGGYTSVNAVGGYTSTRGKLVREPVVEVVAYSTRSAYKKNKHATYHWLVAHKKRWGQESMGYEYETDLYYVYGESLP
jgi:hypothetical protein